MRRPTFVLLIVVLFLSALACGISQPAEANPSDPNAIYTIVAGTANAAAAQTEQANPAVQTSLPPATAADSTTPTATPASVLSAEGTSLVKQSDGSYLFVDQAAGYSIIVPAGWLAVRVNEQEFMKAWNLPEAADPKVQYFLTQIQNSDPGIYRLFGVDTQPAHLQGDFAATFNIEWDHNNNNTLTQTIDNLKKILPQSNLKSKILYADIGQNSSKVQMGIMELNSNTFTASGKKIQIYQKLVLFKLKNGILLFTLSATSDLKDVLLPGFDLMTDQVKFAQ